MWGYVSQYKSISGKELTALPTKNLLRIIQQLALDNNVKYLLESTSLSELNAWKL